MALDRLDEYDSAWAVAHALGHKLGIGPETLRRWVLRAQTDAGARPGPSSEELAEINWLKKENADLREANEILKSAAISWRGNSTLAAVDLPLHRRTAGRWVWGRVDLHGPARAGCAEGIGRRESSNVRSSRPLTGPLFDRTAFRTRHGSTGVKMPRRSMTWRCPQVELRCRNHLSGSAGAASPPQCVRASRITPRHPGNRPGSVHAVRGLVFRPPPHPAGRHLTGRPGQ
jgi:transposase